MALVEIARVDDSGCADFCHLGHANGLETRNAHLHNLGAGIRTGMCVSQKQIIG